MIKENEPCLIARAAMSARCEGSEEIWQHHTKSKRGYFLAAFFGVKFWLYALATALWLVFFYFNYDFCLTGAISTFFAYFFTAVWPVSYLIELIIKIWFWRYSRHVIITDDGIWIMWYSTLWWSPGFDGKKHLLSPTWSLYEWEELHGVFREQSKISKICGLQDLVLDRWDGEEIVRYLTKAQVDQICEYATKCIPARKRKEQREPRPTAWQYIWEGLGFGRRKPRR